MHPAGVKDFSILWGKEDDFMNQDEMGPTNKVKEPPLESHIFPVFIQVISCQSSKKEQYLRYHLDG